VLSHLGVELVDVEFNCCGYPVRSLDRGAFLLSAARNMALAARQGLPILTPCKCCFGTLKHAGHWLRRDPVLAAAIVRELEKEGLQWSEGCEVKHLLTVLARDLGVETIRARVTNPLRGLRVAAHYGCHALRPSPMVRFDNPLAPTIFEELVAVTGAESVDWPRRLECCGNPLADRNEGLARRMTEVKIADARQAGAQCIATACTYCQMQFESVANGRLQSSEAQGAVREHISGCAARVSEPVPAVLYAQLLGWSLGLPAEVLGLDLSRASDLSLR
jgi:heterodisulfide reductase subunit B